MIDEGLIYEDGVTRGTSGIMSKALKVAEERLAGNVRDRVRVRVSIRVDAKGRYYAQAHVIDGVPLMPSGGTIKILDKDITIMVPKPQEVNTSIVEETVTKMGTAEARSSKDLTIDAEFYTVGDVNDKP